MMRPQAHHPDQEKKIKSDFAICGWMLSVRPDIMKGVRGQTGLDNPLSNSGHYRMATERVVIKMLTGHIPEEDMDQTVNDFWDEWSSFQNKLGFFARAHIWKVKDATEGISHRWHQKHLLPFTKALGFVACRVTSKTLGIGVSERS